MLAIVSRNDEVDASVDAAALYGLAKKEAAVQLANDFGLSYEDWKPPGKAKKPKPQQKSPEEQFQEAKNRCFRILADYLHLLRAWRTEYAPHSPEEAFHPRFVEALQKQAHVVSERKENLAAYADLQAHLKEVRKY